jgi:hypothetical protein
LEVSEVSIPDGVLWTLGIGSVIAIAGGLALALWPGGARSDDAAQQQTVSSGGPVTGHIVGVQVGGDFSGSVSIGGSAPAAQVPILEMRVGDHIVAPTGFVTQGAERPKLRLNQFVLCVPVTFTPNTRMQVGQLELRWGDGGALPVYGFVPHTLDIVETHTLQFILTARQEPNDGEHVLHIWALAGGAEHQSEEFTL